MENVPISCRILILYDVLYYAVLRPIILILTLQSWYKEISMRRLVIDEKCIKPSHWFGLMPSCLFTALMMSGT